MSKKDHNFSFNSLPFILCVSMILGVLVYAGSIWFFFSSIKIIEYSQGDDFEKPSIVLKSNDRIDSLSIRDLSQEGPVFKNENTDKIWRKEKLFINTHKSVLNWIVFHSIVLALAFSSSIFIIILISEIVKKFKVKFFTRKSLKLLIPFIILIILTIISIKYVGIKRTTLMSGNEIMEFFGIIFKNPHFTVGTLVRLLSFISIIPLSGIIVINIALNESIQKPNTSLWKYKFLRDRLNVFAFYSGCFVAISLIGTRLQREMIKEQIVNIELIYPNDLIFAYGASFSLFLSLFFLPTLIYLKYFEKIYVSKSELDSNSTYWWKISQEAVKDMKLVFSIFLPMITSLFQSYIEY